MRLTQFSFRTVLFASLAAMTGALSQAQTSVALGLYGAFNGATSGDGTEQSPANQAGGLVEFRQIRNPLVGYEATYSYNRANQGYSLTPTVSCGIPCEIGTTAISGSIPSNAHEITGDWVVSFRTANLRPFALAGGGLLLNVPSGGTVTTETCSLLNPLCTQSTTTAATSTSTEGVVVYGAGMDWELLPHLGLRLQYRGNLDKAPAVANAFSSTNSFTHTAEPVIGVYFRL
ncbi:MAG: outer membrane beta-barrel protein [Terracidiphilus sp.]